MTNLTRGDADDVLARLKAALEARDVDTAMELYAPDADVRDDPFAEHVTGELAIRARWNAIAADRANVEFDVERSWASGPTVLAAWHGAWTLRASAERVRARGFLTLELDDERRIVRERHWTVERAVGADATFQPDSRDAPQDAGGW